MFRKGTPGVTVKSSSLKKREVNEIGTESWVIEDHHNGSTTNSIGRYKDVTT